MREYFFNQHPLSSEETTMLDNYAKIIAAPATKVKPRFGRVFDISDSLYDLSARTNSIDDLLSKIEKSISIEQFATIKSAIQHFAPIYHTLIWEPCLGDLAKQRDEFESNASSVQMSQRLMEVQKFMTSHWSNKDPFTIALIPIPASEAGKTPTSSHSFGNVQVVQIVQGQKFDQKSDVVFHELVHALWHSRSARQNRALQKKYLDPGVSGASAMDGAITLHELNEGLATAIGQGWFQSFIVHQPHYGKWCTDVQTDEFAHHLRPLAAYYIDTAMPIDNIFVQNSIINFKLGFPSSHADPNFVFNDIGFYCDSNDGKNEFKKLLYDKVPRAHNVNFHAPLNTSSSKRFFNYYSDMTSVFLVSPEQLDSLKSYGIKTQVIDDVRSKATTSDARAISILDNSRWLVFCIGKDKDSQLRAFWKALHENEF
ncbi:MAG: hypothetical protein K2X81_21755 [Candidatus Obscuribacterales bacterium]|nr:hypothetical protein [Candidatus Obscuribacterales bacterium]